MSLSFWQTICR